MVTVVKIGGNVIDDPQALQKFCEDFAAYPSPKILVHGGGVMASKMQAQLGQKPLMIEGRRVTDEDTIRTVVMVYAGWINKTIVATLQALGCDAIGISGCDAGIITAKKRPARLLNDGETLVDYGYVGDVSPESVNKAKLQQLIDLGLTPVICPINHDGKANLLNTNADTIACAISSKISGKLLYLFEKNGVLCSPDNEDSVIPEITPSLFEELKAGGIISKGMLPKIENSFNALRSGTESVVIKNYKALNCNGGTSIKLQ